MISGICREYASATAASCGGGTLGFVAIEGTVFVLALTSYFYLRSKAWQWPLGVAPPDLLPGIVNSAILFASLYRTSAPNVPPRTRTRPA